MFDTSKRRRRPFRLLILTAVCLFSVAMSGVAVHTTGSAEERAGEASSTDADTSGERRLIASSDAIALYYTGETQLLEVEDRSGGYIWKSAVDPSLYEGLELSEVWESNLSALFQFTYYNSEKSDKANTLNSNSLSQGVKVTETPLDNGLSLKFSFSQLGISLKLEIQLENDALKVTIPEESIKESKGYKLVSIQPLPFFGAASNGEQGYLVYPDGSGAIHYFNETSVNNASSLKLDIYGSRTWDESSMNDLGTATLAAAKLPVFGMCRDQGVFVAIVEDEAFESSIEVSQSGVSVPFERIANTFTYRRTYTVVKPDVKGGESSVVKMESTLLPGDRSVTYAFLPADSGYSGMANRYRQYLLENGQLTKRIHENDDVPLMLDLFMGISEEQMLMDRYVVMTDFEAAQAILTELLASGVADIRANLIGWQDGGYGEYPNHFPAESALGGNKGLQSLNGWAASAGVTLTLQENYMLANADSGINKKANCVYTKGSLLMMNSAEDLLLITPKKVQNFFTEALLKAKQLAVGGLSFEGIGEYLYPDYNESNTVTRRETQQIWNEMLQKAREETGYVSLVGGNAYLFKNADFLHNVTIHDAGYFMTDETIPLYQMVVHGYIPYTAEEPENLFYDPEIQWLQMLEYGAVPYFQLTENSSGELTDTAYNFLFTSRFEQWKDNLLTSINRYNETYKVLYSSVMVEHTRLSEDVARVTYENGSRLYVNYGETEVTVDGVTIGAVDALVVSP